MFRRLLRRQSAFGTRVPALLQESCLPRRRQLLLELQAALNTRLASLSPKITLLLSEFDSEPSSDEKDEELEEHSISYHSLY